MTSEYRTDHRSDWRHDYACLSGGPDPR